MWSKIKRISMPISIKLTVLYAAILSCILLFTSSMTVAGLYYVLYAQTVEDINASTSNVVRYLAAGKPVDGLLLEENILVPGVLLRIFDEQDRLLINNVPYAAGRFLVVEENTSGLTPLWLIPLKAPNLQLTHIDGNFFFQGTQALWQNGHLYQLHFIRPVSEQALFFNTLIKGLLMTNAVGLIIAILSGIYLSRKILRPLRDITDTAKEIEVKDLARRIPVTESNDELQELAKTFNHMLSRIQTGFEQQRRFTADASHELRTPITVISGYADMLDRWGKQDAAALSEGIDAIKSEAANMHGLIEKLLFLARSDQSKHVVSKIPLDMAPLLNDIVQETKLIAPNHQVVLEKNDSATICADPDYFKEMLRIFIENSIKYTPKDGTIRLASQKTENVLVITITDNGIGIPAEDQSKIFDRFYRVDKSRSKATGGAGLGLSIASWIAEQHSSSIELSSEPGMGTKVVVRIPCAAPAVCPDKS